MNGVLLGWFTTFLVGLAAVLMLVIAAVLLPRAMRIRTERFYCPWRQRNVQVRYVTYDGEHPVAVVSCTALADPMIVTCGAHCISGDGQARVTTADKAVEIFHD